jgi:hypothetical protein
MKRLQKIVVDKDILKLGREHKGFRHERMKDRNGHYERAFYKTWKHWNEEKSWLNFGFGILQDLLVIPEDHPVMSIFRKHKGFKVIINNRDKFIVATVIQWLGTNVGFGFLHEALKKCGYQLTKIEQHANDKKSNVKRLGS